MAGAEAGMVVGGKYRLEEPIGQGGMASVWRAVHTTLESPVAVKFLDTYGISREKMAKRFLREAKLSANLRHRNVVHILDYGVLDDGQPFMVMELLEGRSLADRMEDPQSKPGELELLEIMAQILGGLAAVHDAGIVHRDVKPDNIFIVRDADGDYPKLLDFGISRGVDASVGDTRMTNTGAVVGTPLYMSPEQARGMHDLDARTDLWSVGMVLYEGLAGFAPFESEHMGDVLIRVATEEPPRLEEVRPDLPESVAAVVMRALEKEREGRWDDARAMREALLAAADDLAHGRTGVPRASRRFPSQRLAAAATSSAEWEEGDTEIDPAALEDALAAAPVASGAEAPARGGVRPWMWGAGVAVVTAVGLAAVAWSGGTASEDGEATSVAVDAARGAAGDGAGAGTESGTGAGAGAESGTGTGTGTGAGAGAGAESETETETGTETETESETETETETESETETETESESETETETETETEAGSESETGTETGTEAGSESETGTETETGRVRPRTDRPRPRPRPRGEETPRRTTPSSPSTDRSSDDDGSPFLRDLDY